MASVELIAVTRAYEATVAIDSIDLMMVPVSPNRPNSMPSGSTPLFSVRPSG